MEGDESFVALVHHDGMIRYKTREDVKFTDKSLANVFMTSRTTLLDMQHSIIRKLGLDGRKHVKIYYRILISVVAQDLDPHVGEALRPDDSDVESKFIEGDSDDEAGPVPPPQGGTSSSGTQQYSTNLLNLNLDALSGPGWGASGSGSGAQASQGSNMPAEFVVGQSFYTKEEAVLAVKNYNIRRGVEYQVMESDHAKYIGN
ncbi:hypothetical protein PIB30_049283 [Stylosanthes scabra]|uniref:Uncharacterized protein n=1 Tax=Stylosanthes scabra TaxID=79078 RepID=A0ABU6YJR6_9FABA|nr:hypothetical protein [Stylosanthes scabra]